MVRFIAVDDNGKITGTVAKPAIESVAKPLVDAAEARYRWAVTPQAYGAKGDGATDDSEALQAWLSAPGVVKALPEGTYVTTKGLTCATPDVMILGPGRLKSQTTDLVVLTVTGAGAIIDGLRIDGGMVSRTGIRVDSASHTVQNCTIENFRSTTISARGIDSKATGMVIVRDNVIRMIDCPGNDRQGDSNGMARAIVLHSLQDKTTPSFCTGNWIENITGEEGDAIAVLYNDAITDTDAFQSGWTWIAGNLIHNVTRRHVKVQGSDVWVDSNWCYNDPGLTQQSPMSAIDVVQGNRIRITNNVVGESGNTCSVNLKGSSSDRISDIEVSGNQLAEGNGTFPVIYLSYADNVSITNNLLSGGKNFVSGSEANNLLVAYNDMRGPATGDAFQFTSSAVGRARYNTLPAGKPLGTGAGMTFEGN